MADVAVGVLLAAVLGLGCPVVVVTPEDEVTPGVLTVGADGRTNDDATGWLVILVDPAEPGALTLLTDTARGVLAGDDPTAAGLTGEDDDGVRTKLLELTVDPPPCKGVLADAVITTADDDEELTTQLVFDDDDAAV